VFNHRNASLLPFLLSAYFFPQPFPKSVTVSSARTRRQNQLAPQKLRPQTLLQQGYYVDDGWSSSGPSEMDKDSVAKMGMTAADVSAMVSAWQSNQQAWRDALVAAGLFEWFLFYGGQQTAPGQNQTCGQCTCASYLRANCGPDAGSQNGTLFYGYSRAEHTKPFPLPTPDQDLAMFLLSRGPYAYFGYVKPTRARARAFCLASRPPPLPSLTFDTRLFGPPPPSPPQLRLDRLHRRGAPLHAAAEPRARVRRAAQLLLRDVAGQRCVDAQLHARRHFNGLRQL
jgi:hypothetical protein